ncbi:hypothetical protein CERZMDRAFT_99315 [Cercospora zeae-maydis SCOH1-5]|uniref:Uncharacterized protein n=1 Tax=Cercospora zeae-maydis SCOH1-5 TaxID=717836 RepID=A0A6A6FBE3_9PEZI|nr:hypothetical protein CERZMDRAFT_99315 [Cercospora zeae-maydis SCOH1-5]
MPPPSFKCYMAVVSRGFPQKWNINSACNPWLLKIAQPPQDFFANTLSTETYQSKVQTWLLLPPDQQRLELKQRPKRNSGLKGCRSCPWTFPRSTCSHSHPGQVLSFKITVKKNDANSTAESMPDILILSIQSELVAQSRLTNPD